MDINSIRFENFINEFYSNSSNNKMVLTLDVENSTDPNFYDIHTMLLDLLIKGIERYNLNICDNLEQSISKLQIFFTNINIKINVNNYSKSIIVNNKLINKLYSNRYIKFNIENPTTMLINGAHQIADKIDDITSFFLINDIYNISISFNFII